MSDFSKNNLKINKEYYEDSSVETDVLIREEAEFLAKTFLEKEKSSFGVYSPSDIESRLNALYLENKKNEEEIRKSNALWNENKEILQRIEEKISGNTPVEAPLEETAEKSLEQQVNENREDIKKAFETLDLFVKQTNENFEKLLAKKEESENQPAPVQEPESVEESDLVEPVTWDSSDSKGNEVDQLVTEFQDILDQNDLQINDKLQSLADEIDELAKTFDNYVESAENDKSKLVGDVFAKNNQFSDDINFIKNQYENLEKEVQKLYSTWVDNNQLLNNLETLLSDLAESNSGFSDDIKALVDNVQERAAQNQVSLNNLTNELGYIKDKIIDFDNRVFEVEKNSEKLFNLDERIVELSKQVVLDELSKRDLLDVQEILKKDESVENILSSPVFQESLESKITRLILLNNNYLGDEFATKFDKVATEFAGLSEKVHRDSNNFAKDISELQNEVVNINNNLDVSAFESEVRTRVDSIDSKTNLLYTEVLSKYENVNKKVDDLIENQEKNVRDILENSLSLDKLIEEKVLSVVDDKLEAIHSKFEDLSTNLEDKLEAFVEKHSQKVLEEKVDSYNAQLGAKIKDETLNAVYQELIKRDEKINLHSDELVRNYEIILENNKILETLEKLVLQQVEQADAFKRDREETIELLMSKITGQKQQIEDIKHRIGDVLRAAGIELAASNGPEAEYVLESIKQLTAELVQDELKKLNVAAVAQPTQPVEESNGDFFINRVKDIISKLDESPLLNGQANLQNLDVSIEDLKQNNPTVEEDDDFGWFYEKEYENYVSQKQDKVSEENVAKESDNSLGNINLGDYFNKGNN